MYLSSNFSDPYIQKEALQTFATVHWSVSRQMTPRHLRVSSERAIFRLGYWWINSTESLCEQKEGEAKILNLVSSVERKITERIISWKNIYLI